MLPFQEHIASLIENIQRIFLIVFAAQTKQHASIHLADHESLQSEVHFDSRGTVFAAYAFPERVVTVENDYFERVSFQVEDSPDEDRRDSGTTLGCIGYMS